MKGYSELVQALGIVNCAVLKRVGQNTFETLSANTDWLHWLLPDSYEHYIFTINESSPYLLDFLIDAEDFWANNKTGRLHSGMWSEDCEDFQGARTTLRLEAFAAVADNTQYLVINNVAHEFKRQQQTLQAARELLITNEKMQAQHDYLNARLSGLLAKNADLLALHLPVQQAIQNTHVAVVITDGDHNALFTNPAVQVLFETKPEQAGFKPHDLIRNLLRNQFPEHERIYHEGLPWSGELYWHHPPAFHKWLQAGISPVINNKHQVTHWIYTLSDNTRVKYLLQRNENLALHDVLTQLPNRQYFWQTLVKHIDEENPFYLIYIDLQGFKRVNELHGHAVGDEFLVQAAERLSDSCNENDFIARIGADEFAILQFIGEDSPKDAHARCDALADRLLHAFSVAFYTQNNESCLLPIRVGISNYPLDAIQPETLVKAADMALNETRHATFVFKQFYSAELQKSNDARLKLETQLREAIEKEQLQVYLQPILDLKTETLVKAEALLRWRPSSNEAITPDVFIPIAERTGLIVPLGKWVIEQVCQLLSDFRKKNINIKLSINLSPKQVSDRYLFDFIKTSATKAGIDAEKLELELTEGVLIDDYEKVARLLSELRKMGVSIAIDDFGTGYSSLSYLKHLPIDHLKIDRSFVFDLDTDDDDKAIVLAILAMAKQLKLSVIAEGVETEAQRNFLKQHNCTSAQGFFYSKALSVDDFYDFIEQEKLKIR